ncbi:MAG TPA: cytochrome c-type biogenesis protein CcmH [Terriglobales bacterium]|nr:cytochrome c-type biogenesis protein CcmH [Terriglobales bacterium]
MIAQSRRPTACPRLWPSLLMALLLAAGAAEIARGENRPSFQEIEESLTCQCGCGLTVHSCNHLQCPSALPLRAEIREQLAAGKDKPAILAHFRDKYGEKVLSSPTTAGFNLLAWMTPFAAVLIGGLLVVLVTRRWTRRDRGDDDTADRRPPTLPPGNDRHRQILDAEMKDFDQ